MRECDWCGVAKLEEEFGKNTANKTGKHNACKKCVNAKSKANAKSNPEKTKQILIRHMEKRRREDPSKYLWKKARDRVKYEYSLRDFTIVPEDIIIPHLCPYLNVPLNSGDPTAWASLDRIDSTKGYIPGNIQVISILANQMKNRATEEQLIAFAKGVLVVHSKEVCCDAPTSN